MKPMNTTTARFPFDVLRSPLPTLVDFHAEWCPQCRRLAPLLEELAAEWDGDVRIVKVDVERNPHLADRYGIRKIPTLILFDRGEEAMRLVEVVRREALEESLAGVVPLRT